jgi:hypothetical protein
MFHRNTVGHHKANSKDRIQNRAQMIMNQTTRFSVQALLLDMSGVPTRHVEEACREPEQNSDPQLLPDMSCVPIGHVRVALNNIELLQEKNKKAYQTVSK